MIRQYDLIDLVKRYNPNTNEALLNRAYVYGQLKHGAQTRASGDPYFTHPLEVAAILTDMRLDDATIATAILHDTIEDTDATRAEIDQMFGSEIGGLVESLTKLKRLDFVSKKTEQAENFRRLLVAIAADVRVLLVKLADRLHNMRTLGHMPEVKRARIAEETMEIYAPLAGRMGMQGMREELEDLSFRTLMPEAHAAILMQLDKLRATTKDAIPKIEKELAERLRQNGIKVQIHGREKKPYSIYNKQLRKQIAFEQLSDIYGFRVIVRTVEECYRALGVIHTTWPMVPGRFKDYISTPKQNDYRSIHTTVIGPNRRRVEMQIRTDEMHRVAEYGIAAHAMYKDGERLTGGRNIVKDTKNTNAYTWLKTVVEQLNDATISSEDFVENTRMELFQDQVFCFTPKGQIIALPRGATTIDFAYAVHTNIGNTAVGAKINGRIMPLFTELSNGDEVEILRAKTNVAQMTWEKLAVTGKARAAIRRASRDAARQQFGTLGRQILDRAFERAGKPFSDELLEQAYRRLGQPSVSDTYAAVGRGEVSSRQVIKAVYPDYKEERATTPRRARVYRPDGDASADAIQHMPIRGLIGDLPIRFAPNGGAVPGDRIVGILEPGEGITVYPIQSPALAQFENDIEKWVDLRWDIDPDDPVRFPAQIALVSINEPGSLAQISQVIADNDGNIDNIKMVRRGADSHDIIIDLEVWDVKHLNRIIGLLKSKPFVSSVVRVNG
jgi:GTP diphosphokinase / guanosine-3',5'-bis(diphosphate) 3'-diphosphatase